MCEIPNLVPIPEWASWSLDNFDETHPEFGINADGAKCFRVDACIVPALKAVWAAGFKTLGCCCGHGQGHGVISLSMGDIAAGPEASPHHCSMCGLPHDAARIATLEAELADAVRGYNFHTITIGELTKQRDEAQRRASLEGGE